MSPINPYLYDSDAVQTFDKLTRLIAKCAAYGGPGFFALPGPSVNFDDDKVYIFCAADWREKLPDSFEDVYEKADGDRRITGYRIYLINSLKIAGTLEAEAMRFTDLSIKADRRLRAGR